jgi:serine/threonine-protein kinase
MAGAGGPTYSVGDLIDGRYEVQGFLGAGGYGEVYAVLDRNQGVVVALKMLAPVGGGAWHEARVLTKLRSEYILPVWNAATFSGVPYLVTELAVYGTLTTQFSPLGVAPSQAVQWVIDASRGAQRTHDANLVHRDIKPDNIFLNERGRALLGDFGIASLMNSAGQAPPHGSAVTLAPEVAAGGPTTRLSDVYSLGATLYAILAARYPFEGPTHPAIVAQIVAGPPPPLRDLAPNVTIALAKRVDKAMSRNPTDRYPTAMDFAADLGRLRATSREWWRTDEHTGQGHVGCWRGEARGKAAATVCVIPAGKRFEVEAAHQPSGRRITAGCRLPGPASALPRMLRAAMAAVA